MTNLYHSVVEYYTGTVVKTVCVLKIPLYNHHMSQGLTRACPSHNAQFLSSLDAEIEPVQDNGCILPVPHLIVLEGDGSTLWPVLWDLSLFYVSGGLRLTVLCTINKDN